MPSELDRKPWALNSKEHTLSQTVIDISELGGLAPSQPVDVSAIPGVKPTGSGFPRAGRYTVRAPESFTVDPTMAAPGTIGKTQAGNVAARVDPVIVGPSHEGYQVRFTRISAKDYTSKNREGKEYTTSQVAEYLTSFGVKENLTGDPQQAANLIASTAGQSGEVYADWVAEHRPTGYKLVGMRNFPVDANGNPQPWVEHPDENVRDAEGNRLRLRARLEVRRWIPKRDQH